jgi:hypothetical protein
MISKADRESEFWGIDISIVGTLLNYPGSNLPGNGGSDPLLRLPAPFHDQRGAGGALHFGSHDVSPHFRNSVIDAIARRNQASIVSAILGLAPTKSRTEDARLRPAPVPAAALASREVKNRLFFITGGRNVITPRMLILMT